MGEAVGLAAYPGEDLLIIFTIVFCMCLFFDRHPITLLQKCSHYCLAAELAMVLVLPRQSMHIENETKKIVYPRCKEMKHKTCLRDLPPFSFFYCLIGWYIIQYGIRMQLGVYGWRNIF